MNEADSVFNSICNKKLADHIERVSLQQLALGLYGTIDYIPRKEK